MMCTDHTRPPNTWGEPGDRRIGMVWHTQGSGKSLTMVFYAGRIIRHPAMENSTIVVLTDRNDLDGQLFGVFSRCRDLLGQEPIQAESRAELRELLRGRQSGGVIFTTIQKFLPEEKAVEDKATVPIYYESRLAKLDLPEELKPRIDEEFEEVTEGEEIERKEMPPRWGIGV